MSGAIGLIVPSLFVKPGDLKTMQTGFNHMAYGIAIFTTIAAVVLFVCKYSYYVGRKQNILIDDFEFLMMHLLQFHLLPS